MAISSVFGLEEFKPYEQRYMGRLVNFTRYRRYYDGSIYNDSAFKLAHKLYAQTKSLLSFLARAVDLDIALVPGVMGPWELSIALPDQIKAQALLYAWSNWSIEGDDWLEDGATCGEAFLKIVPKQDLGTIEMERLKPELCFLTKHPVEGQIVDLALIVDRSQLDNAGKAYEYAEAITPALIRTYWNGQPHDYDGEGSERPNPLGFVPVVQTKNDSGCRPTFSKTLPQLNSVNELASYLADIIGRHAEPQWAIAGAEQAELEKSGNNVWFMPKDATLQAILANIDIGGTLEFIQELKGETKSNLPELAFDDLRAKDQIATETLEVQLVELDAKIWKMRRRYDNGLLEAHRMAATVGLVYGIGGLEPLLAPHQFDFKRPVRPISKMDQIAIEQAEIGLELQKQMIGGEGMTSAVNSGAANAPEPQYTQSGNEGATA